MTLVLESKALAEAAKWLLPITEQEHDQPEMATIVLTETTASAWNRGMHGEVRLTDATYGEWATAVNGKALHTVASRMKGVARVEPVKGAVVISSDNAKVRLPTLERGLKAADVGDAFPMTSVPAALLSGALSATSAAAAAAAMENARRVRLEGDGEMLRAVATDGYRLSVAELGASDFNGVVQVGLEAASMLIALKGGRATLEVGGEQNVMRATYPGRSVTFGLGPTVPPIGPTLERLEEGWICQVDPAELRDAVQVTSAVGQEVNGYRPLAIEPKGDILLVSVARGGEAEYAVEMTGDPVEAEAVHVNAPYMTRTIGTLAGSVVTLSSFAGLVGNNPPGLLLSTPELRTMIAGMKL